MTVQNAYALCGKTRSLIQARVVSTILELWNPQLQGMRNLTLACD